MSILTFILKTVFIYILSCAMAFFVLWMTGTILDIENIAWTIYEYLHSHYGLYEDIYKYDFNPVLGDVLIIWMLILPASLTFIVLIIIKYITKRRYK